MRKDAYHHSKIPLPLILLLLVNIFVIVSFELLIFYPYPSAIEESVLGKFDSALQGCTILSHDEGSSLDAYLAKTQKNEGYLVVVKSHPVVFSRAKFQAMEPVALTGSEQVFPIKNGIHTAEITVTGHGSVEIRYDYNGGFKNSSTWYLALGAALEGLELLAIYFIKKNL